MNFFGDVKNKNTIIPFALLLAAFSVRCIAMYHYQFIGPDGGTDGVAYAECGKNIFSGRGLTFYGKPQTYHPPLYSILIGAVWYVTKNLEFSGQFASVLMGSLTVLPVFFLARTFYGLNVALLSATLVILNKDLIGSSITIRAEATYTLLAVLICYIGYATITTKSLRWSALLGIVIAMAYLTKPEGFIFFLGFIPLILLSKYQGGNFSWQHIFAKEGLLIIFFLLFALPYIVFLHDKIGKWTISGKSSALVLNIELAKEGKWFMGEKMNYEKWVEGGRLQTTRQKTSLASYVATNLFMYAKIFFGNAYTFLKNLARLFPFYIVIVTGIGFFSVFWRGEAISQWCYLIIIGIITAIPILLFFLIFRHLYQFIPLFLLWAGKGIEEIMQWIVKIFPKKGILSAKKIGYSMLIIMLMLISLQPIGLISRWNIKSPFEYKLMGEWMRKNMPTIEEKTITARKLGVAFYAGAKWKVLYYGEYQGLIEYMKDQHIEYLIIDTWTIPWARPQFAFLLDEVKKPPELTLIHTVVFKNRKVFLYQLAV